MAQSKKPTARVAKVIGPVPRHDGIGGVLWRVRLAVPYFPFHLDGQMNYHNKADADKEAEKWRRRKVTVTVEGGGK